MHEQRAVHERRIMRSLDSPQRCGSFSRNLVDWVCGRANLGTPSGLPGSVVLHEFLLMLSIAAAIYCRSAGNIPRANISRAFPTRSFPLLPRTSKRSKPFWTGCPTARHVSRHVARGSIPIAILPTRLTIILFLESAGLPQMHSSIWPTAEDWPLGGYYCWIQTTRQSMSTPKCS